MNIFVEEFLLETADKYGFLSNGNLEIHGVNDATEYSDTIVCYDWLNLVFMILFYVGSNVYYGYVR